MRRIEVIAEEGDFGEADAAVEGDGFGLAGAGFEHQAAGAELAGFRLERCQYLAANTATTGARRDVHPLDLGDVRLNAPHGATADRFARDIGNEKCAAAIRYFVGIQAKKVCVVFSVAVLEFGIQQSGNFGVSTFGCGILAPNPTT